MTISCIESNNAVNTLTLQNSTKSEVIKSNSKNEIQDVFTNSDETSKFKEIVSKYDITNMSRNEANEMYKELHDNDLISLKDMAFAIFDPTRIPGWKDGSSSVNGWKMSSNPDEKMNFLEGIKTSAEFNKIYGDSKFQDNFDKMLELAEKINYFQL